MTEKKRNQSTVLVSFRIPEVDKKSFELACAHNDQTASQVFRALARKYVEETAHRAFLRTTAATQVVK